MNILLLILTLFTTTNCNYHPEPETYLMSNGFTGRATIIFNQTNGAPVKYENGRRVYEIPANGILLTQFKEEYSIVNHQYFYVDSSTNQRISLPVYITEYRTDGTIMPVVANNNEVGIFGDGATGQYSKGKRARFQSFSVSSLNGLDTLETVAGFNERVNQLVGTN